MGELSESFRLTPSAKICKEMYKTMRKNLFYYVRIDGKPYSFGKACRDLLSAHITLDKAKRCYPNEAWGIVEICA